MRNNCLKPLTAAVLSIMIFAVALISIIPNYQKYLSLAFGNFVLSDNHKNSVQKLISKGDRSNWQSIADVQDIYQQGQESGYELIAFNIIQPELKKPLIEFLLKTTILSALTHQAQKLTVLKTWVLNSIKNFISYLQQGFHSFKYNEILKSDPGIKIKIPSNEVNILSDHVEINVNTLPYERRNILMTIYAALRSNESLCKLASESNLEITPHLVYRYLAAADWNKQYNGKR